MHKIASGLGSTTKIVTTAPTVLGQDPSLSHAFSEVKYAVKYPTEIARAKSRQVIYAFGLPEATPMIIRLMAPCYAFNEDLKEYEPGELIITRKNIAFLSQSDPRAIKRSNIMSTYEGTKPGEPQLTIYSTDRKNSFKLNQLTKLDKIRATKIIGHLIKQKEQSKAKKAKLSIVSPRKLNISSRFGRKKSISSKDCVPVNKDDSDSSDDGADDDVFNYTEDEATEGEASESTIDELEIELKYETPPRSCAHLFMPEDSSDSEDVMLSESFSLDTVIDTTFADELSALENHPRLDATDPSATDSDLEGFKSMNMAAVLAVSEREEKRRNLKASEKKRRRRKLLNNSPHSPRSPRTLSDDTLSDEAFSPRFGSGDDSLAQLELELSPRLLPPVDCDNPCMDDIDELEKQLSARGSNSSTQKEAKTEQPKKNSQTEYFRASDDSKAQKIIKEEDEEQKEKETTATSQKSVDEVRVAWETAEKKAKEARITSGEVTRDASANGKREELYREQTPDLTACTHSAPEHRSYDEKKATENIDYKISGQLESISSKNSKTGRESSVRSVEELENVPEFSGVEKIREEDTKHSKEQSQANFFDIPAATPGSSSFSVIQDFWRSFECSGQTIGLSAAQVHHAVDSFQQIDQQFSGRIDLSHFVTLTKNLVNEEKLEKDENLEENAKKLFASIDTEGCGYISLIEILPAYSSMSKQYGSLVPADYPQLAEQKFASAGFASPAFASCAYATIASGYAKSFAQLVKRGDLEATETISPVSSMYANIFTSFTSGKYINKDITSVELKDSADQTTQQQRAEDVLNAAAVTETEKLANIDPEREKRDFDEGERRSAHEEERKKQKEISTSCTTAPETNNRTVEQLEFKSSKENHCKATNATISENLTGNSVKQQQPSCSAVLTKENTTSKEANETDSQSRQNVQQAASSFIETPLASYGMIGEPNSADTSSAMMSEPNCKSANLSSSKLESSHPTSSKSIDLTMLPGSIPIKQMKTLPDYLETKDAAFWNVWESYGTGAGLSNEQIHHAIETFLTMNEDLSGNLTAAEFLTLTNELLHFKELGPIVIKSRTRQVFSSLLTEGSPVIGIKEFLLGYKALTDQYGSLLPGDNQRDDADIHHRSTLAELGRVSGDIDNLISELSGDSRQRNLDPNPSPRTHIRLLELEEAKNKRQQETEARRVQEEKEKRKIQEEQERQREIARIAKENDWSYDIAENYFNKQFNISSTHELNQNDQNTNVSRSSGKCCVSESSRRQSNGNSYGRISCSREELQRKLNQNERERKLLEAELESRRTEEEQRLLDSKEQLEAQRKANRVEFESKTPGNEKIFLISRWQLKQGMNTELKNILEGLAKQVEEAEEKTLMYRVHIQRRAPLDTYFNAIIPQPNPINLSLQSEVIFFEGYLNAEAFSEHVKGDVFNAFRLKTLQYFQEDPMVEGWPKTITTFLDVESAFSRFCV